MIGKDKTRKIVTMTIEQSESLKFLAKILGTTQNQIILTSIAEWIENHKIQIEKILAEM